MKVVSFDCIQPDTVFASSRLEIGLEKSEGAMAQAKRCKTRYPGVFTVNRTIRHERNREGLLHRVQKEGKVFEERLEDSSPTT